MNSDPLPKTYLDIAIHDYDPVVKAKIYEIVAKSGIPQNDPYTKTQSKDDRWLLKNARKPKPIFRV